MSDSVKKWQEMMIDGSARSYTYLESDVNNIEVNEPEEVEISYRLNEEQEAEDDSEERKGMPVFSGVVKYFPDAIKEVSKASMVGNEKHCKGQPLHWNKEVSKDDYDAMLRHLMDHQKNPVDTDGLLHLAKVAWRALAGLQRYLEDEGQH